MIEVRRKRHKKIPSRHIGPRRVKVGLPSGGAETHMRYPGDGTTDTASEKTMVEIAVDNHYGHGKVPSRPWLLNSMRENRVEYLAIIKGQAKKIVRGETTLHKTLTLLGIKATGDAQVSLTNLRTPPNSPVTIERKGSSNPLIDHEHLRGAHTYEVT